MTRRPLAGGKIPPQTLVLIACLSLAMMRLWYCLCAFPAQEWNDMRLRVTFLLFDGLPLYPGLNAGPITTWMYGPVLPCLLFPATLGSTIDSALLIAGALNAGLLLSAFIFTTLLWPQPVNNRRPFAIRLLALSLSLLLLPQAFFVFLQADNAALACGLVSLTCLARAGVSNQSKWWWAAASFAGATVFSKLHGVAVPAAEIIWIWLYCSRGKALRFTLKLILVSASLSVATLMISGTASGAWEAIIRIPAKLPFATNWEKRLTEMTPYYFLMVILPGILVVFTGRQHHKNSSNLNLPTITWLVSLPLGLAGTLSVRLLQFTPWSFLPDPPRSGESVLPPPDFSWPPALVVAWNLDGRSHSINRCRRHVNPATPPKSGYHFATRSSDPCPKIERTGMASFAPPRHSIRHRSARS